MLTGSDKGVVSENIRTLKNQGMSERDATLVSMKHAKKSSTEKASPSANPVREDYPYGLRIDLDTESLDKLGLKKLPSVNDTYTMTAKVKVQRVSSGSESGGSSHSSATLQITHMKLA